MAQSFFRAIARRGKISSLRTLAISARCSSNAQYPDASNAQYPDAQYSNKMPDDVDFFYPELGNNFSVIASWVQNRVRDSKLHT